MSFVQQSRQILKESYPVRPESFVLSADQIDDFAAEFESKLMPDSRSKEERLIALKIAIKNGETKLFGIPVEVQK